MGMWNVLVSKKKIHCLRVNFSWARGERQKGFLFAGKQETVGLQREKKRFLAQSVPCDEDAFLARIPNSKGEHSLQILKTVGPMFFIKVQNDFGIAGGSKPVPTRFQVSGQFAIIVDFAVTYKVQMARFVGEGLLSCIEIDNRQAAVPQPANGFF